MTDVADSGLVVDSELSRSVGMSSARHLCLARRVEAAKADAEVRGAGDGGSAPVGIDMRFLGERAPIVDPVPVGIVLSRQFATLMLDERTPPVFVPKLGLLPALKLVGPVEVARLMLPGRVEVGIESGVTACARFGCREGNAVRDACAMAFRRAELPCLASS